MNDTETLRYIEFNYGKLGKIRKIKWNPELGDPVFRKRFVFADEYGEDWGIVVKEIPMPEDALDQASGNGNGRSERDSSYDDFEDSEYTSSKLIDGQVIRYFTEDDDQFLEDIRKDEPDFLGQCRERVKHHSLDMKMLATDIRFDRKKVTFHFAADGRVDFRMLVRDLASIFRCRIELHQIGARDEASLYVGVGQCGRTLCCRSWLKEFKTIGIKMARAQNLPLNPGKISGNCGRLLCCLSYEYENYLEMAETLPKVGDQKEFDGRQFEVTYVSPLNQTVTVQCLSHEDRHKRYRITGDQFYAGELKTSK
jgi:cell fate regulator YaaT (PSP1 superfamily)